MKIRRQIMKQLQTNQKNFSLLSCSTRSIPPGSSLGDGSLKIHKGYKNARFSFRHSIKQQEYFMFKRNAIKNELSSSKDMWEQLPSESNVSEWQAHKLRYQSRALPASSHLHLVIHKGGHLGRIRIQRKWLNMLTAQSLAIWWCDDGSLVNNTKQGVFCTDGFSLKDVQILDRYMKKVWNIDTAIFPLGKRKKDGTQRYRLWIRSVTEPKKFPRIIIPYIPVYSMLYKVIILYKNSELQQRWISEIVENSQYDFNQVENLVNKRKSEFQAFQRMI